MRSWRSCRAGTIASPRTAWCSVACHAAQHQQGRDLPRCRRLLPFQASPTPSFPRAWYALHALVLIDSHFPLLVTPGAVGTLSRAMGWSASPGCGHSTSGTSAAVRCGKDAPNPA
jgi:hypothetical protein